MELGHAHPDARWESKGLGSLPTSVHRLFTERRPSGLPYPNRSSTTTTQGDSADFAAARLPSGKKLEDLNKEFYKGFISSQVRKRRRICLAPCLRRVGRKI